MKKKIYLIGSGGHASSCIDVIEQSGIFKIEGIFSDEKVKNFLGYKILGSTETLLKTKKKLNLHIAFGSIKNFNVRKKLFNKLKKKNHNFPSIISSKAILAKRIKIGEGSIIFHSAVINSNAVIGNNCIINTMACIEHDTIINNHAHISTCAIINGNCKIGEGTFIGSSTVLKHNITVGSKSIIGFGKVIGKNIITRKIVK